MNKTRIVRISLFFAASALLGMTQMDAQLTDSQGGRTAVATARGSRAASNYPNNALVSPEVHDDRTVTFRFRAPLAKSVSLIGEITRGQGPQPLSKDDTGIWSLTTVPLDPEIWIYNFRVDGVDVLDPSNPSVKPVPPGQLISNFVEVPGASPAIYDSQAVPHGQVRMMLYESKAMGFTRALWVYTPPGYDTSKQKYPALYLLHGNGEDIAGWVRNGRANIILDNLLATGKIHPMLVVMPQGHALQAPGVEPLQRVTGENSMFSPLFPSDLLDQVIPLVEHEFRVRTSPDARAIAGLSMGGGQALSIGLSHPELFRYVLGYSAAIGPNFLDLQNVESQVENNPTLTNQRFKLIWISIGRQDFLFGPNHTLHETLAAHDVHHQYVETEGAHVWSVWRKNLAQSLPLLFR
ncbi:esterase [Terriglobus sp. TAA 43]|uniref:esterase n=1 Tax=Terriglobus sp. TAA 43 TaxID=278961 RepID=UPI00068FB0AF|nr:esterase [Terriglobus sp. TAA 43]